MSDAFSSIKDTLGSMVVRVANHARQKRQTRSQQRQALAHREQQARAFAVQRQQAIQAHHERCVDEALYRRIAIEAAYHQAHHLVSQFGFNNDWVNSPWFNSEKETRTKYQFDLVQQYMTKIMGGTPSPIDQLRQQNAYGNAALQNGKEARRALNGQARSGSQPTIFED